MFAQNCSSQEDIKIYPGVLFDQIRCFRFNYEKRYQKWKILFCTKSMRDTKKILGEKIVRFTKIYKFGLENFYSWCKCGFNGY